MLSSNSKNLVFQLKALVIIINKILILINLIIHINKNQLVLNFIGDYDKTKFRDDIDIDMAVKAIGLTFDGLSMKWIEKPSYGNYEKDLESLFDEVEDYINFYKKLYYKGGK